MRAEARATLLEVLDMDLGNASSVHDSGRRARAVIDDARERVAAAFGVSEDAIVFTSGGTESNNLALFGAAAAGAKGMRVVTSRLEHAAVKEPVEELGLRGYDVAWANHDHEGRVDLDDVAALAGEGPALISVMAANNEIGSTTDLAGLRERIGCRRECILHSDAVQLVGKGALDGLFEATDLVSASAHKVGGPIGVGILVKRPGIRIAQRTFGGTQEAELRPGTENVAAIASAARALELAVEERASFECRMRALVQQLHAGIVKGLPDVQINGPPVDDSTRLCNTLNISVPGSGDARMLVAKLDLAGLDVSAGSACASGSLEPSHVVRALGHDIERSRSALRLSLGRTTDAHELSTAVERLCTVLGGAS